MIERNKKGIYTGKYKGVQIAYPSVTTVLNFLHDFSFVDRDTLERARLFGTAVHEMVKLYNEESLDEESLDQHLLPCFYAYEKFIHDFDFTLTASEQVIASHKYQYAGRFDLIGNMNGQGAILDIKTRKADRVDGLQLAAYIQAYHDHDRTIIPKYKRYTLELKVSGDYTLTQHTNRTDFQVFLSCLNVFNWRGK